MTEPKALPPELALDSRAGWPADLRLLVDRYPREVWGTHANLGALAQFWLQRHDMFREIGAALTDATTAFREGTASVEDFRAWFPPRLQFFLQQLNSHHQVEDLHYFPVFQAAEANAFLRAPVNDPDPLRLTGERYVETSGALLRLLTRHLADEEDLIIPLILDRGEAALGAG
jgi:iron-sulfur cluster repair protein YtfE (RIC family)